MTETLQTVLCTHRTRWQRHTTHGLNGKCSVAALDRLRSPFDIDGYKTKPAEVEILYSCDDYTQLSISIHEGRNRQIRKMCEQTGLKLTKLQSSSRGKAWVGRPQARQVESAHWAGIASAIRRKQIKSILKTDFLPQTSLILQVWGKKIAKKLLQFSENKSKLSPCFNWRWYLMEKDLLAILSEGSRKF